MASKSNSGEQRCKSRHLVYLSVQWGRTGWRFLPHHRRRLWPADCHRSCAPVWGRYVQQSSLVSQRTSPLKNRKLLVMCVWETESEKCCVLKNFLPYHIGWGWHHHKPMRVGESSDFVWASNNASKPQISSKSAQCISQFSSVWVWWTKTSQPY